MDPTERFCHLASGPETDLPLDELGFLIAAHAHRGLDVSAQLGRLDALADRVTAPTLDAIRQLLFDELGFAGNEDDYYDPRNSYLDAVLDRRTGIPISLAVVLLEVGRRVGVPLAGVAMPGHFLVRHLGAAELFVDPFARGLELDGDGCRRRFHALHGPVAAFDASFLRPVGRRAIVERQLANLEAIARARGETFDLIWILRLRAAFPEPAPAVLRGLGAALGAGGRHHEGAAVLEGLAATSGDDAVATEAINAARALRARLN